MKYIILALLLVSCGSRRVDKTDVQDKIKTETTTNIVDQSKTTTNTNDNTKIVDTSTTDEIEFIPLDNSLPFIVNGKEYKNVQIRHKKNKTNISIVKEKKVAKIEDKAINTKVKQQTKQKTDTNTKFIEKKESTFIKLWWWWLIIIIVLLLIYLKEKYASK